MSDAGPDSVIPADLMARYEQGALPPDILPGGGYCHGYTYDVYRPGDAAPAQTLAGPEADTPLVVLVSRCRSR